MNNNEKKYLFVSIFSILVIFTIVAVVNSSFNYNNNTLFGKAIENKNQLDIDISSKDLSKISVSKNINYIQEQKKCESVCPFGFEILNSTCKSMNSTCMGNVVCGFNINGTIYNMTNGHCASLNVFPGTNR